MHWFAWVLSTISKQFMHQRPGLSPANQICSIFNGVFLNGKYDGCMEGSAEGSSMRELIFIQAGPASNWVGGHFWNLQEGSLLGGPKSSPFNHSIFYRVQESTHSSSTFGLRPRLLAIDVLGSVRSPELETGCESNSTRSVNIAWDGKVQTVTKTEAMHALSSPDYNKTQPRFWTDCLLCTNRRRWRGEESLQVIRDYLDASSPGDGLASPSVPALLNPATEDRPFESPSYLSTFNQGLNLFHPDGVVFDCFENYFRRLSEECDRPSGFVFTVDSDSGFAGVGLRIGEHLSEEFAKRPIFTTPVASVSSSCRSVRRWSSVCLNRLALYTELERAHNWSSCSAWLPLYSPSVLEDNACKTGARLASGLATFLTPLQMHDKLPFATELHEFITALTPTRKKMLSLSLSSASPPHGFPLRSDWLHLNPFSFSATKTGIKKRIIQDKLQASKSYPISFATQLATSGVDTDVTQGIVEQWTKESRTGHACRLSKGLEAKITSCLPENPLTVPHVQSSSSRCTQESLTRTATVLEAISHWSNEDQWLACGLRRHLQDAFVTKFHTDLELDDLKERQENTINRLIDAYASSDD